MRRLSAVLVLSLLLFQSDDAQAQPGSITGVLRNASTSEQIGGAVTVFNLNGQPAQITGILVASPTTPYLVVGLVPGTYLVKASSAGYIPELHSNIACIALDCPVTAGTPVVVSAGATVTVDFALASAGAFSGTVRRASDGSGLSGLGIAVYNASTSLVASVTTGVGGTYTVGGLAAGTYFARVERGSFPPTPLDFLSELYGGIRCPSVACRIASGAPIAVTEGATTTGIDFSLDQAGTISGTVMSTGTSTPLASVIVRAFAGGVEAGSAAGFTNASGQYSITGLPPGAYRVRTDVGQAPYVDEWYDDVCVGCAGTPAAVSVADGATVGGINFSLTTGGAISGTVTCEPSVPFVWNAGPVISVFDSSGVFVRSVGQFPGSGFCFPYLIEGLAAGQYYLLARDVPIVPSNIRPYGGVFVDKLYGDVTCNTADCDVRRGVPVTVTSGNTTAGIDFNMRKGATSPFVPAGEGTLSVFDARGVELVSVLRGVAGQSQQVTGLPPGTYFARLGDRLHGRGACPGCPPTSGRPIVIGQGDTDFALDFGAAPASTDPRISGTVRDAAGSTPLSSITVELYTVSGYRVSRAVSDLNGNYVLPGSFLDFVVTISPGLYFLRTRNERGYVDEVFPDAVCAGCDVRIGTPVVVGTSDVTGIDFTLAAGGLVGGTVTDAGGVAVGGVPVSLFAPGGSLVGQAVATADGIFRATVPAGGYRARAEASAAHGAEVYSEQPCTSGACDVTAGTPIAVTTGTLTPTVNFTLASCSAMTMSPTLLASGVVGRTYRQVLSVSGGASPFVFRVTEGVLPFGVTLTASTGVLAGLPLAPGRHAFTVGALDANGCAAARAYTLDVQDCTFTLSPSSATVPATGGSVTIIIGGPCGSQAVTSAAFVTVQSNLFGLLVLDVPANPTGAPRTDDITIGRRVFTVRQAGVGSQPPFGSLDVPTEGAQVSGSLAVGGWALDDLEVSRVQIFRDPIAGEPPAQVFLGTAVFVAGARPDIQQAFPTYPLNGRGGWGFLILTNMLPNQGNGAFRIYAYAEDAEGARSLLGARTIVANNAAAALPFGAIDTPGQGETIAGSGYLNWGWALTPQPKIIPFDGSTIQVIVDGVPLGTATYNLFRADVAGLFPGLANSGGPVGYRVIDTTALSEGQHTIAWIVTDSAGAASGIGSRYFTVANAADAQAGLVSSPNVAPATGARVEAAEPATPIALVAGPESGRHAASLAGTPAADESVLMKRGEGPVRRLPASGSGARTVTLKPLERVELTLGESARCAGTWAGYLVDQEKMVDLPVGAAIDPAGTFYWQPGPGFIGTFQLLFVRTACDGSRERLPVTVTIHAR